MHGQTYQGHPSVCAAALEVQRVIKQDGLLANVKQMGFYLEKRLKDTLELHPYIGDIRGRGLFWGVRFDLSPRFFVLMLSTDRIC